MNSDEFSISSEGYIINHIDNYMEPFGMMNTRRNQNELFYRNTDPMRTWKRRRLIRTLSYKVEVTDSNVIITLETTIVIEVIITAMIFIVPFFLLPFTEAVFLPAFGLAFYFLNYLIKLNTLLLFKSEVEVTIRALN